MFYHHEKLIGRDCPDTVLMVRSCVATLAPSYHKDTAQGTETPTRSISCLIFISGNDNSRSQIDNLWLQSPFIRSIIDSPGNIRENLIILPDFSYQEIKTGMEITEGIKEEVLMFNSSTKHLLETLGMDLRNNWTTGDWCQCCQ